MPVEFKVLALSELAPPPPPPQQVDEQTPAPLPSTNRLPKRPREEDVQLGEPSPTSELPPPLYSWTPADSLQTYLATLASEEASAVELPPHLPPYAQAHFLASKNTHSLDRTIILCDGTHRYYVQWSGPGSTFTSTDTTSVSGLVHGFFPHFDPDAVLVKIRKSRGYGEGHRYYGRTDEEIKQEWADNGAVASAQGTKFHALVEYFYNGFDVAPFAHFKVVRQFLRFHAAHVLAAGLVPFRTEMRLRSCNELRLTGTIDALFVASDHPEPSGTQGELRLHMKDWKFSKEIKRDNPYERGERACAELPNCNFYHYALQQNLYKWLLETYYTDFPFRGHTYARVRVVSMQLVVGHDSRDEYELVDVPELPAVLAAMLAERRAQLESARGADADGLLETAHEQ